MGLLMVADVLDIAVGVLAVLVVRSLTGMRMRMRMRMRRAAWTGPGHDSPAEASGQPA
ncbi:hypothetical protein ACFYXH_22410 [Streptomyces sp. NPDC002730]|uniref:hypothetical protein n=1 Tax=Streptomyces sp. NPDC002730 TaxID=3364662 RepID=UPI0036CDB129